MATFVHARMDYGVKKEDKSIVKKEGIGIGGTVIDCRKRHVEEAAKNKIDNQLKVINKEEKTLRHKIKDAKEKVKENRKLQDEISKLVNSWLEVMVNKKYYNEAFHTMTLAHIKKEEDYGWSTRIYVPYGKALEDLDGLTPAIESGLHCKFMYTIPEHKEFAIAKIIYLDKVSHNNIPFKPAKVKPYEIFIGVDITGRKIVLNVNDTPHILVAGQTRKGKNASGDHFITSLIHSCSPEELELYLFQCAKNDLIKYADCKQVKSFVLHDFEKMESELEKLLKEINRRLKLLQPMVASLKGDNLYDYNKLNPSNKLPYTYVIVDEFMVLTLPTKDKEIAKVKQNILAMLEYIGEMGGSVGVNYAIFHQKPSKELCPTFIKNMSLIRVCFGFDDESCGRIVLGEKYGDLALKLPARRAYYSADGKIDLMFTTNLREADGSSRIKQFIEKSIVPGHKTLFDDIKEDNTETNESKDKLDNTKTDSNKSASKGTAPVPKSIKESKERSLKQESKEIENENKSIDKPIEQIIIKEVEKDSAKETGKDIKISMPKIENINSSSNNHFKVDNIKKIELAISKQPKEQKQEYIKMPSLPKEELRFDNVDPTALKLQQEKLKENINKIPNYVPFNPNQIASVKVIDKTKIDLSKTEKPKKKGTVK